MTDGSTHPIAVGTGSSSSSASGGGAGAAGSGGSRSWRGSSARPPPQVDVGAVVRMGITGGLGAVPGTLLAYPLDVLKIRMQSTASGGYRSAAQFIVQGGHLGPSAAGPMAFYRGVVPAVELRIVARGSQFLCSELCSQLVERHTSLSGITARCAGSFASGYATGLISGIAEYRKKLMSQGVVDARQAGYRAMLQSAVASGQGRSLLRRLHAAGCRSAVNDACFFSMQYYLSREKGWSATSSYAAAATCGVIGAFLLDTAVARMMLVPPCRPVPGMFASTLEVMHERCRGGAPANQRIGALRATLSGLRGGYRGISARAMEFMISYGCTGMVSSTLATIAVVGPSWSWEGPQLAPLRRLREALQQKSLQVQQRLLFAQDELFLPEHDEHAPHFLCADGALMMSTAAVAAVGRFA